MSANGQEHQTLRQLARRRDVDQRTCHAHGFIECQSIFSGVILRHLGLEEFIQLLRSGGECIQQRTLFVPEARDQCVPNLLGLFLPVSKPGKMGL